MSLTLLIAAVAGLDIATSDVNINECGRSYDVKALKHAITKSGPAQADKHQTLKNIIDI